MRGAGVLALALLAGLPGCASRGSVKRAEAGLAAVRDEIDGLRHAQEQSVRDIAALAADLKAARARLDAVPPQLAEDAAAVQNLGTRVDAAEAAAARAQAAAESAVLEPARAPAPMAVAAGRPSRAPETAARGAAPERAYAAALDVFQAREYGQAVLDFLDVIARYPKHPLAGNAQYWIGEAYYVQRDYRQAAVEFQKVVEADARSAKAPDALLKIGLCYVNLHQPTRARELWQQVVRDYPDSEAARKARALIRARSASSQRSR